MGFYQQNSGNLSKKLNIIFPDVINKNCGLTNMSLEDLTIENGMKIVILPAKIVILHIDENQIQLKQQNTVILPSRVGERWRASPQNVHFPMKHCSKIVT